jgi:hypothetical protein
MRNFNVLAIYLIISLLTVFTACKQDGDEPAGELAECRLKVDSTYIGNGTSYSTQRFTYDNQGRLVKVEFKNNNHNNTDFQSLTYNAEGFITKIEGKSTTITVPATKTFILDNYTNFFYENGLLKKAEYYRQEFDGFTSTVKPIAFINTENLEYDNQQRLSTRTSTNPNSPNFLSIQKFTYEGNSIKIIGYDKNSENKYILRYETNLTYDSEKSPYSLFKVKGWPNNYGFYPLVSYLEKGNVIKSDFTYYVCSTGDCSCDNLDTCDTNKYQKFALNSDATVQFGTQSLPVKIITTNTQDDGTKYIFNRFFTYADCK